MESFWSRTLTLCLVRSGNRFPYAAPSFFLLVLTTIAACDVQLNDAVCQDDSDCGGNMICVPAEGRCVQAEATTLNPSASEPNPDAGQAEHAGQVQTPTPQPDVDGPDTADAGSAPEPDAGSGANAGIYTPIDALAYQDILGRGIAASWFKQAPVTGYSVDALVDMKERGFDNVRLRIAEEIFVGDAFNVVEDAIDDCVSVGLVPILSWVDHEAETNGSAADRQEYISWWSELATKLRGKSYTISFNLFTEIGNGTALDDIDVYNDWTAAAVQAIRAIDPERIIILSAPSKTVDTLSDIDPTIYAGDNYMLAEWHLYASGPNQNGGQKNWVGDGSDTDRQNVRTIVRKARRFTEDTGIPTYFGAWMPMDNNGASLTRPEVESFARYLLDRLSGDGIPWTVNAVQQFYDTETNSWLTTKSWGTLTLQMPPVVDILVNHAEFGEGLNGF